MYYVIFTLCWGLRSVPAEKFPQWRKSFDSLIPQTGFDITLQIIIVVALKRVEMAEMLNAVILQRAL